MDRFYAVGLRPSRLFGPRELINSGYSGLQKMECPFVGILLLYSGVRGTHLSTPTPQATWLRAGMI